MAAGRAPRPDPPDRAAALGVDVGGANLKWGLAVGAGEEGRDRLLASGLLPFALWREPAALPDRLREVDRSAAGTGRARGAGGETPRPASAPESTGAGAWPPDRVALSLTGELADCFPDRVTGVRRIVEAAVGVWGADRLRVHCRDGAWRTPSAVEEAPRTASAANWRAPAEWLAARGEEVLLADMGSTTTDLVPVRAGSAGSGARTDVERMGVGELVYTGLLRTPVCAMIDRVEMGDAPIPVAAELFAVAADVHLWLGNLTPDEYRCETPDGGPATREASGRRLARMVCSDPEELGTEGVDAVARAAARAQARRITEAVDRQRRRMPAFPGRALATGAGADLLAGYLVRAGLEAVEPPPPLAGSHAPAATAATLALLALERGR